MHRKLQVVYAADSITVDSITVSSINFNIKVILYTLTQQANQRKKERKNQLSKNKRRKKERVTVGSGVEWTANDEEKMAVVESRRCE
jgi:hypothetical protein